MEARSLFCYWAVRDLGVNMTSLAKRLKLSVAAITQSVVRGKRLKEEEWLIFHESENVKNVPCFRRPLFPRPLFPDDVTRLHVPSAPASFAPPVRAAIKRESAR